jgi:MFS family permease
MFYGWRIVIAGTTCFLLLGGIGFYSFGVFFSPLTEAFNWTRTEISLAITIACLVGLSGFLIGKWIDKYGARKMILLGALISGISFALLGLINSLWQFYALYLTLGLGLACASDIAVMKMVSNWFSERRGLATGIVYTGYGLGGFLMPLLASYFVVSLGWRASYHFLGLLILVILIPLSLFLIKEKPEDVGLLPDGKPREERQEQVQNSKEWTLKEALKTRTYPLIVAAMGLAFLGIAAVIAHLIPFLEDRGLSPQLAAVILSATLGISILGRIIVGYLSDRMPLKYLATFLFLLQAGGLLLLLKADSEVLLWVFAFIFGLAIGGLFVLAPLLIGKYFGTTSFGELYGGIWALTTIGWAGGPPLAGYIFDLTRSYNIALLLFIAMTILAIIFSLFIKPPKPLPT